MCGAQSNRLIPAKRLIPDTPPKRFALTKATGIDTPNETGRLLVMRLLFGLLCYLPVKRGLRFSL
jgi:hypothetical protein